MLILGGGAGETGQASTRERGGGEGERDQNARRGGGGTEARRSIIYYTYTYRYTIIHIHILHIQHIHIYIYAYVHDYICIIMHQNYVIIHTIIIHSQQPFQRAGDVFCRLRSESLAADFTHRSTDWAVGTLAHVLIAVAWSLLRVV